MFTGTETGATSYLSDILEYLGFTDSRNKKSEVGM